MSTTSLKMPDDLKARAISAARTKGITPHAFMLDAIRSATSAAEKRGQFIAERWPRMRKCAKLARATMRRTCTAT